MAVDCRKLGRRSIATAVNASVFETSTLMQYRCQSIFCGLRLAPDVSDNRLEWLDGGTLCDFFRHQGNMVEAKACCILDCIEDRRSRTIHR
jgi:hypothetical protein